MRNRPYKFITVLLAFLLAASSWVPAHADAQMRCAGASPQSAPCARAELAAVGLTERQVYGTLMACCRSMHDGCATMQDCPMRRLSHRSTASHGAISSDRATSSARRCVVSVRLCAPVPASLAVSRLRWLLSASPALAPPVALLAVVPAPQTTRVAFWTYTAVLSPHAAPALHGLRAPPAA